MPTLYVVVGSDTLSEHSQTGRRPRVAGDPRASNISYQRLQGLGAGTVLQQLEHGCDVLCWKEGQYQQLAYVFVRGVVLHKLLLQAKALHLAPNGLPPVEGAPRAPDVGQDRGCGFPHSALKVHHNFVNSCLSWQHVEHRTKNCFVVFRAASRHNCKQQWYLLRIVSAADEGVQRPQLSERLAHHRLASRSSESCFSLASSMCR